MGNLAHVNLMRQLFSTMAKKLYKWSAHRLCYNLREKNWGSGFYTCIIISLFCIPFLCYVTLTRLCWHSWKGNVFCIARLFRIYLCAWCWSRMEELLSTSVVLRAKWKWSSCWLTVDVMLKLKIRYVFLEMDCLGSCLYAPVLKLRWSHAAQIILI